MFYYGLKWKNPKKAPRHLDMGRKFMDATNSLMDDLVLLRLGRPSHNFMNQSWLYSQFSIQSCWGFFRVSGFFYGKPLNFKCLKVFNKVV